jgi:hypothetical protein
LAGLSYGAAGYLDKPGISAHTSALVSALSVTTPSLFLVSLVGLRSRVLLGTRGSAARSLTTEAGFLLGCLGTVLGIVNVNALGLGPLLHLTWAREWWLALLFAGLVLMGIAALPKQQTRLLGALVLASGVIGWASSLTDSAFPGVLEPARRAHVGFAAAFCVSAILWGGVLLLRSRRLARLRSQGFR